MLNETNGAEKAVEEKEPFNMLQYVRDRKFEREKEDAPQPVQQASSPAPVADHSKDIDALRRELLETKQQVSEFRSKADTAHGALQAYMARERSQANQPANEDFPTIEVSNPELAAALNALKTYTDKSLDRVRKQTSEERAQSEFQSNVHRFEAEVKRQRENNPDFKFTDDQLVNWAKPYIGNPNIDWKSELTLISQTHAYPHVKAELAAANKKIAELEKGKDRERESQKANLSKVPAIGTRNSGSEPSGRLVGDQILSDFKRNNKGKRPSWEQFGSEFARRKGYN